MLNRSPGLCHEKALARGGRGAELKVLKEIRISKTRMVKSLPRAELYGYRCDKHPSIRVIPNVVTIKKCKEEPAKRKLVNRTAV